MKRAYVLGGGVAGMTAALGLADRGHLAPGAWGDITVYKDDADRERMFTTPEYVFKNGELIVRDGRIVKVVQGATHVARPDYDRSIEKSLQNYFSKYHTVSLQNFKVHDDEIIEHDKGSIVVQPTGARV